MNKATQSLTRSIPRHVAIIMDGNNRWAKERFLPVSQGIKLALMLFVQ